MSMKVNITGNIGKQFAELAQRWPGLQYGLLAQIGYEGRRELYESKLRGQVIDLRKYPHDIAGRRTVSYGIAKNRKSVKISAYPLNLYHPREVYGSATAAVRTRIESKMQVYDERVLQRRLDQIMKGTG